MVEGENRKEECRMWKFCIQGRFWRVCERWGRFERAVIWNCVVVSRRTNIVPQHAGPYCYRLWFIFQLLFRLSWNIFQIFIRFVFETLSRFTCRLYLRHCLEFVWFIFETLFRFSDHLYLKHCPEFVWFIFETLSRFSDHL